MRYQNIFFDLDGTITDSEEGIVRCLAYALEKVGISNRPREELASFIGPPLDQSLRRLYNADEETILAAARYFRERYHESGMLHENRLYSGIDGMIRALSAQGKRLYIVSTKDEGDVTAILQYFGLYEYFAAVRGGSFENEQAGRGGDYDKAAMIREILARDGIQSGAQDDAASPDVLEAETVMVGDRDLDINAGHANNIPVIGVLYGYGSREELTGAGADLLVGTVAELAALLAD